MSETNIASSDGMNHGRFEIPVRDWLATQGPEVAMGSSGRPRMLSHLQGEVLHRVGTLKGDAERLAKAMGQMADIDSHAVERGMIALRRAMAQLEGAVTCHAARDETGQFLRAPGLPRDVIGTV